MLLVAVWVLRWAGLRGYLGVPIDIKLLGLLIENPTFWVMFMLIYPTSSVWPQEMIYRRVFIVRYRPTLGDGVWLILVNALVFGWAHVLYEKGWAIFFTLIGGWLFAETYHRTRLLLSVCLEHALYGCWLFSVGLGSYFLG